MRAQRRLTKNSQLVHLATLYCLLVSSVSIANPPQNGDGCSEKILTQSSEALTANLKEDSPTLAEYDEIVRYVTNQCRFLDCDREKPFTTVIEAAQTKLGNGRNGKVKRIISRGFYGLLYMSFVAFPFVTTVITENLAKTGTAVALGSMIDKLFEKYFGGFKNAFDTRLFFSSEKFGFRLYNPNDQDHYALIKKSLSEMERSASSHEYNHLMVTSREHLDRAGEAIKQLSSLAELRWQKQSVSPREFDVTMQDEKKLVQEIARQYAATIALSIGFFNGLHIYKPETITVARAHLEDSFFEYNPYVKARIIAAVIERLHNFPVDQMPRILMDGAKTPEEIAKVLPQAKKILAAYGLNAMVKWFVIPEDPTSFAHRYHEEAQRDNAIENKRGVLRRLKVGSILF